MKQSLTTLLVSGALMFVETAPAEAHGDRHEWRRCATIDSTIAGVAASIWRHPWCITRDMWHRRSCMRRRRWSIRRPSLRKGLQPPRCHDLGATAAYRLLNCSTWNLHFDYMHINSPNQVPTQPEDQHRNHEQEQSPNEPGPESQRELRASQGASNIESRHRNPNRPIHVTRLPEIAYCRNVGHHIDNLCRCRRPQKVHSKKRMNRKISKLPVPGPKKPS